MPGVWYDYNICFSFTLALRANSEDLASGKMFDNCCPVFVDFFRGSLGEDSSRAERGHQAP
jgi:hypothetical protein